MLKTAVLTTLLVLSAASAGLAQQAKGAQDTVMVLPFENETKVAEYNWVGEGFAHSLSELLRLPGLSVVTNEERKVIQQRLNIPLSVLPSLAASIKMANEARATLLVTGSYRVFPQVNQDASELTVVVKTIRVGEGRFMNEDSEGRKTGGDIVLTNALGSLQTINGEVAFKILYQRDDSLAFERDRFTAESTKVPWRAYQAYVKGLAAEPRDVQSRAGYFGNALRIFAQEKEGAVYEDAALELGHLFLGQRDFNKALDYFSGIPQGARNYHEAAFYAGLINFRQARFEAALAALKPLAEDLRLSSLFGTVGGVALFASRSEKKDRTRSAAFSQESAAYLARAIAADPENTDARFNLALGLFLNGSFAESLEHLKSQVASKPSDGEAFFLLAKALEAVQDAAAADTDNQARILLRSDNRYARLQEEWMRAKTVDGINPRVFLPARADFIGSVMSRRSVAAEPAPDEVERLLAGARELYSSNHDDKALSVLRRILVIDSMSAESYYLIGMIHVRRKELVQAVNNLETALFWDPRLFDAHLQLAFLYIQRNDCLKARNRYESAREVDPKREELSGLQRQLERCSK